MKGSSKSCNCKQCKAAKASKAGRALTKKEERIFRHQSNQALRQSDDPDILPAGHHPRMG